MVLFRRPSLVVPLDKDSFLCFSQFCNLKISYYPRASAPTPCRTVSFALVCRRDQNPYYAFARKSKDRALSEYLLRTNIVHSGQIGDRNSVLCIFCDYFLPWRTKWIAGFQVFSRDKTDYATKLNMSVNGQDVLTFIFYY